MPEPVVVECDQERLADARGCVAVAGGVKRDRGQRVVVDECDVAQRLRGIFAWVADRGASFPF